jgi:hypothetical protein
VIDASRKIDPGDLELFVRTCSDCRKPIMWAKTVASDGQEWIPLDADPLASGNVIVFRDPEQPRRLLADVVDSKGMRAGMRADGWSFWQHHRLSCPRADQWARRPKHLRPQPTGIRKAPDPKPLPEPEGLF